MEMDRERCEFLGQTIFVLDPEDFDAFVATLDLPPETNEKLKALFATKAPWEKAGGP
jgi:uncharacterized protein (DUF1778 family)